MNLKIIELLTAYATNELRASTDASYFVATFRLLLQISGQCKAKFGHKGEYPIHFGFNVILN